MRYINVLIILIIFIGSCIYAASEQELKVHSIFNQKLLESLKLDEKTQASALNILNHASKQLMNIEDHLKSNTKKLKTNLKKAQKKENKINKLIEERLKLIKKLQNIELLKIQQLKKLLKIQQLARYFLAQEKLIAKFKKSIDLNKLTEVSNQD